MSAAPSPCALYHLTSVANLSSILAEGCLLSYRLLHSQSIGHTSIAYNHIQARRAQTNVPCGPGGGLHDYVPFSFAPRSPMLYTIHQGNVPGYSGGQQSLVHLMTTVEDVRASGLPFVFTDGHACMAITSYYADSSDLDQIDWAIMRAKMWNNTLGDGDRKRRRQAEFLVYQRLPFTLLRSIGVRNSTVEAQVRVLLRHAGHKPVVLLKPDWYY